MTPPLDVNAVAGGLLRDLGRAQTSREKMFGFKRAAAAVLRLDEPLAEIAAAGRLVDIHGIGPASARIIEEVLTSGRSSIVDRQVVRAGRADEIAGRRRLRRTFLSRAGVLAILRDRSLTAVSVADYHGDFQMHSEWSDGSASLAELAAACVDRGYTHSAVSDHSHGLKIAGGMSMVDARAQHREIDALNHRFGGSFRWLKGVEANIGSDGTLDLSPDEAAEFEVVLAAPHSKLRRPEDQTHRMIAALENPAVRILAHPRGRITDSRAGIVADWDEVFARAAAIGVAVEIDGDPSRQDLDYELGARALAAGCVFALDSDAHGPSQLAFAETAMAHARLAGIPADRIINCWPMTQLMAWLGDRRAVVHCGKKATHRR
jgi:histidinol phosphatase-like PHP family hydrolase